MFVRFSLHPRQPRTTLFLFAAMSGALVWLALTAFRPPAPASAHATGGPPAALSARTEGFAPRRTLEEDEARAYLERTGEGRSLMRALEVERFGLKWQERAPFADASEGGGYLGMSHDENLSAWFDASGVTVRPTLPEQERDRGWRLGMRLKAYGYGAQLHEARASVSGTAKESRIEYERGGDAGGRVVEWYVNRSGGIEQGFTLDARPARAAGVEADEPLRLVVGVTGDLHARAAADGQSVELNRGGEGVLSYSKLTAFDARGEKLAARMETNEAGDEIALLVEDATAQYPIVVDPITATQRQELSAGTAVQAEARFGFSVAVEGNFAAVGAWREDLSSVVDAGFVYTFIRSGTNWAGSNGHTFITSGAACGWSVAISGDRLAFSCPGTDRGGHVFISRRGENAKQALDPNVIQAGARFGESVAISGNNVVVGAPFQDSFGGVDAGAIFFYTLDSNLNVTNVIHIPAAGNNSRFGTSVDIDVDAAASDETAIVGSPGENAERGQVYTVDFIDNSAHLQPYQASDGAPGDRFGNSVALDGKTLVVGASGDDNDRGTDAGAAYVFTRATASPSSPFSQQQKLTAGDGGAGDAFSEHAVAVEGNTIVVGAFANGQGGDPLNGIPDDDRGAVYVFTSSNGVWSQQTKIGQSNFQGGEAGDAFGIDVDISGNTLIIGARAASAGSTVRAGAAFIYELDCLPPSNTRVVFLAAGTPSDTVYCPGFTAVLYVPSYSHFPLHPASFQWRKNGVNIPGATGPEYRINPTTVSDAGSYDVVVTTACGSEIASPATLKVVTHSLSPTSPQNFSASGANSLINVTSLPAGSACGWSATSNASWITINSGSSGSGNGTVGFTVAANTGAQRTGTMTIAGQTFTVTQDGTTPPASTFQFGQSSYSAGEGAGSLVVTVTRTGNTAAAANVDYATTDGTANERGDYTTALGTLRFAAGETAKTFRVFVTDDVHVEANETLNLTLSNPTGGAALGSPASAAVTVNENDSAPTTPNPIDNTAFFVRQHYVDFLNREPDASGLSFWSNNVESCGASASCREAARINVSAAFFLSIEFQETGFLAHRFYRAALNRFPRYREFLRDTQEIGRGVIVRQGAWEAQLEANKQQFASDFVARDDFRAIYAGLTNEQYVEALNANAGGSLSTPERNALVTGLNGGAETRATALRKIAEDADFAAREFRPAFVLAEYIGYLRRNPDDAPDTNFDGFNFWLGKLNEFNGNYVNAEMVKAFISSIEYRQRFGQ